MSNGLGSAMQPHHVQFPKTNATSYLRFHQLKRQRLQEHLNHIRLELIPSSLFCFVFCFGTPSKISKAPIQKIRSTTVHAMESKRNPHLHGCDENHRQRYLKSTKLPTTWL